MELHSSGASCDRERVFERRIIHWCAPTLAGIKPASLFTFVFEDGPARRSCSAGACRELTRRAFVSALARCRARLRPADIGIDMLAVRKAGVLLFVYRGDLLVQRLREPHVAACLMDRGYNPFDERGCVREIARRIRRADGSDDPDTRRRFPHEIGFLLGYPYGDVVAFMENRADGVRAGAWMAYGNVEDARACACRYRRCRFLCEELDRRGVSLERLACMDESSLEAAVRAA